jgi:hypothetical protein
MLEKPDISLARIAACLQNAYGVTAVQIIFLPLGADQNTAVYRIETTNETAYFLKLRSGVFVETAVTLPQFLHDQGIRQIITPLTTKTGQLCTTLDDFTAILYPFVDGRNGREVKLSAAQWAAFGAALKKLHTLYIVDWDDPLLAPKERDLMFIGGAQGFVGYNAQAEEALFYQGYGPAAINSRALAYYRYERIIEDIALFCEHLLLSNEGGQDRAQSLRYLVSNFLPDGTIEAARRVDERYDLSYGDTK